ncbi:Na(+)-translocating NADH-quinone reductase subunit F [Lutimonas zeaxanthinifaciens]|uniref:Na(+)-translocating NADH-quinone reductase subunit F n=1 Tax=Lutimonas zeaxanthinifaciens TaxID=3060215 RepID=UPI00265CD43D|nr:Na(+)-translocating NADH-quinone reductase subunit F [Lutimonas sp. YSD2104]WKK66455.1 Na(+)-translocating NADH-quinone reductase subunit F [Lutimonas sp. YSD2104]
MLLTKRLERALDKMYTAFYKGELDPEDCKHCAVGNICDNYDTWKYFTDIHGSRKLNYLGNLNEYLGRKINGYSPAELIMTEAVFLRACGYTLTRSQKLLKPAKIITNEMMFNGLCAAVDYLCRLDGVENVMDQYKELDFTMDKNPYNSKARLLI